MKETKELRSLRSEMFKISGTYTQDNYVIIDAKQYAKKRICQPFISNSLESSIFDKAFTFISKTILKDKDINYLKLLCKLVDEPDFKMVDFTGTEIRILKNNHIPSKSVKVYSKILETMTDKLLFEKYFPKHHKAILDILATIMFCSKTYEFHLEYENLPF